MLTPHHNASLVPRPIWGRGYPKAERVLDTSHLVSLNVIGIPTLLLFQDFKVKRHPNNYSMISMVLIVFQIDEYLAERPELKKTIDDDIKNMNWYLPREFKA